MTWTYRLLPTFALGLKLTSCGVDHDLGCFQSRLADGIERACGSASSCTIKLAD